jgi:hypothetical protein
MVIYYHSIMQYLGSPVIVAQTQWCLIHRPLELILALTGL